MKPLDSVYLILNSVALAILILFVTDRCHCAETRVSLDRKYVYLDEESVAHILIHSGGTALSFPVKPSKVILGKEKSFDLEYIENDLIVAPLAPSENASLFVYLLGRRFTFNLIAVPSGGDRIVIVKDKRDKQIRSTVNE